MMTLADKRILLIIGGGIAAYKSLDLIRRLRERGATLRVVMTKAAAEFVTPLSVEALSNSRAHTSLFDLDPSDQLLLGVNFANVRFFPFDPGNLKGK